MKGESESVLYKYNWKKKQIEPFCTHSSASTFTDMAFHDFTQVLDLNFDKEYVHIYLFLIWSLLQNYKSMFSGSYAWYLSDYLEDYSS